MKTNRLFVLLAAAQMFAGFSLQGAVVDAQESSQLERAAGCSQKSASDIQVRLSSQLQAFFNDVQALASSSDTQEAVRSLSDLRSRKVEIVDAAVVLTALQEAVRILDARSSALDSTVREELYKRFEDCCKQFDSGVLVVSDEERAPQPPQTAGPVTPVGATVVFPPGDLSGYPNEVPGNWVVGEDLLVTNDATVEGSTTLGVLGTGGACPATLLTVNQPATFNCPVSFPGGIVPGPFVGPVTIIGTCSDSPATLTVTGNTVLGSDTTCACAGPVLTVQGKSQFNCDVTVRNTTTPINTFRITAADGNLHLAPDAIIFKPGANPSSDPDVRFLHTGVDHTSGSTFLGEGAGPATSSLAGSDFDTAVGFQALGSVTGGFDEGLNSAFGVQALMNLLSTGASSFSNVAVGAEAGLFMKSGDRNTFVGSLSGEAVGTNPTDVPQNNTFLGYATGLNYSTNESNNICIGSAVSGQRGESNTIRIGDQVSSTGSPVTTRTCYIGNINGITPAGNNPKFVIITDNGQLGTGGPATFAGALTINGTACGTPAFTVSKGATILGNGCSCNDTTLTVRGRSQFDCPITAGTATTAGSLTVNGTTTAPGTVTINGSGDGLVSGSLTINGVCGSTALTVNGDTVLNCPVTGNVTLGSLPCTGATFVINDQTQDNCDLNLADTVNIYKGTTSFPAAIPDANRFLHTGIATANNNTFLGVGSGTLNLDAPAVNNTGVGSAALSAVTTGTDNTALGYQAGNVYTDTSGNISIGSGVTGLVTDVSTIRIGTGVATSAATVTSASAAFIDGTFDKTSNTATTRKVVSIGDGGQLGTEGAMGFSSSSIQTGIGGVTPAPLYVPGTMNTRMRIVYGTVAADGSILDPGTNDWSPSRAAPGSYAVLLTNQFTSGVPAVTATVRHAGIPKGIAQVSAITSSAFAIETGLDGAILSDQIFSFIAIGIY